MPNRAEKRFGLANHRISTLGLGFLYAATGISHDFLSVATCRLGLESLEDAAATKRILVNRRKSSLGPLQRR